jgi:hypothetical protein
MFCTGVELGLSQEGHVFGNKVLRRIFGPNREEKTREQKIT